MPDADLALFHTLGAIGLIGSALLFVADVVLVYSPVPLARFNVFSVAPDKTDSRLAWGSLLGVAAIPLVLAGFAHMYLALRPAGPWLALPPVLLGFAAYIVGAGFHAVVPLYVVAIQETRATDANAAPLVSRMSKVFVPLQRGLFALVRLSSLWLMVTRLAGHSAYPRWMAAVSPLTCIVVFRVVMRVAPPAVVGVLFPAGNNLALMIFLICSLAVVGS